jgi:hypothetical protein
MVGVLILSGAVNTAIVGANGVLNRMSEDGVLTPWFRKPHPKFGTSYRIINLIVGPADPHHRGQPRQRLSAGFALRLRRHLELRLQVAGRRGAALHRAGEPGMEGPGQFPYQGHRDSGWAGAHFAGALRHRVVNLFTKELATISGVAFSVAFFAIFTVSERITAKQHAHSESGFDQFNIAAECRA